MAKEITRKYACRAKLCKGMTVATNVTASYDPSETKIKDLEQDIKEEVAMRFSKGNFKLTADDIKINRIK